MKIIWEMMRSALAIPKRVKRKLKPKSLARKGRFIVKSNPLKDYRQRYPSDKLRQWALARQAEQLARAWPAEMAFKEILDDLEIHYSRQFIIYRTGSFILIDFYIPARKLAFELDGTTHTRQVEYDAGRDRWLLETQGIRTIRISNATAQRNRAGCEAIVKAELEL